MDNFQMFTIREIALLILIITTNFKICNNMVHAKIYNRWRSLLEIEEGDVENFKGGRRDERQH